MFDTSKASILQDLARNVNDKSPKGNVDSPIIDLVNDINSLPDYCTTSSCSGRVSLFHMRQQEDIFDDTNHESSDTGDQTLVSQKGSGSWIAVDHDRVWNSQEIVKLVETVSDGVVLFKHEPFVMHIQCRNNESAQALLKIAIACGFRESGISLGTKKIMLAIRTTANVLEMPLSIDGQLVVQNRYLDHVCDMAKQRFDRNATRVRKLHKSILDAHKNNNSPLLSHGDPDAIVWQRFLNDKTERDVLYRRGHSATLLPDRHSILIFGGHGGGDSGCHRRLNDVIRLDMHHPENVHVEIVSSDSGIPPRIGHTANLIMNESLLIIGGRQAPTKPFGDMYTFHISNKTSKSIKMNGTFEARWGHSACNLNLSTVVIFGGRSVDTLQNDVVVVSVVNGDVANVTSPLCHGTSPSPRYSHAACMISQNSKMLVHGGYDFRINDSQESPILRDMHILDLNTFLWTEVDCTVSRFSHQMLPWKTSEDEVLIVGGVSEDFEDNGMQRYCVSTNSWEPLVSSETYGFGKESFEMFQNCTIVALGNPPSRLVALGGGLLCFSFGYYFSPPCIASIEPTEQIQKTASNCIRVPTSFAKTCKSLLEDADHYEKSLRMMPSSDGLSITVPVKAGLLVKAFANVRSHIPSAQMVHAELPMSKVGKIHHSKGHTSADKTTPSVVVTRTDTRPSHTTNTRSSRNAHEKSCDVVLVPSSKCKLIKTRLENENVFNKMYNIRQCDADKNVMAIPLVFEFDQQLVTGICDEHGIECKLENMVMPPSKIALLSQSQKGSRTSTPKIKPTGSITRKRILELIITLASDRNLAIPHTQLLEREIPNKLEVVEDVCIIPSEAFKSNDIWGPFLKDPHVLYEHITKWTNTKRILMQRRICDDVKRQSQATMVYPRHAATEVTVKQNGILYHFDMEKCMFSSGNISEKLRVSKFVCSGETVVDLFAGIGYFTLPYLVKTGCTMLHACEWNQNALQALRQNLELNHVASKCIVHAGDCRETAAQKLVGIADRVNLGLIPSSRPFWEAAVQTLRVDKTTFMHVHENVRKDCVDAFVAEMVAEIAELCKKVHHGASWEVKCVHVENVKSYSPKVNHMVFDLQCRPASVSTHDRPSLMELSTIDITSIERVPYPRSIEEAKRIYERNVPVIFTKFWDTEDQAKAWHLENVTHLSTSGSWGEKLVSVHVSQTSSGALDFVSKNFTYEVMPFREFLTLASENDTYCYMRAIGPNPRKDKADFWRDFPELAKLLPFPDTAVDRQEYFSSIFRVASKNVQLWTHFDVMHNILYQLHGRKRLVLFKPSYVQGLQFHGSTSRILDIDNTSSRNPKDPFLISREEALDVILEPGEAIFIPALWPHNSTALDESLAMNIFWRHLSDSHYGKKDLYGNRDPLLAEQAERLVKQARDVLQSAQDDGTTLPAYYVDFYGKKFADILTGNGD